jgi:hypothetical protein
MRASAQLVLVAWASLVGACDSGKASGTGFTQTSCDTVRIPTAGPDLHLRLVQDFAIGTVAALTESQFSGAVSIVGLAEGAFAVLQKAPEYSVRLFDSAGRYLRHIDLLAEVLAGGGWPMAIRASGDTIAIAYRNVHPVVGATLQLVGPTAKTLDVFPMTAGSRLSVPVLLGPAGSGRWFVLGDTARLLSDGRGYVEYTVYTVGAGAEGAPSAIVKLPRSDSGRAVGREIVRPLFGHRPVFAAGPGPRLYIAPNGNYEIDIYPPGGERASCLIMAAEQVQISEAARRERAAVLRQATLDTGALQRVEAAVSQPGPLTMPVVGSLWVGGDGSIAVERRDLRRRFDGSDSTRLDLLEPDGIVRGRIVLPPRYRIADFTGAAFFVVEVDSARLRSLSSIERTASFALVIRRFHVVAAKP